MVIYKCDICNREVEGHEDLDTIGLATKTIDLCWFCRQKMKEDYSAKLREFDNNYIKELRQSIK